MTLSSFRPDAQVGISPRLAEDAKAAGINWIHENNGHYYAYLRDVAFHVRFIDALDQMDSDE